MKVMIDTYELYNSLKIFLLFFSLFIDCKYINGPPGILKSALST